MRVESYIRPDSAGEMYVAFRAVANRAVTEAHFARVFERDPETRLNDDMPLRPVGEFHLLADRAGVEVLASSVRTQEQLEVLAEALEEAFTAHVNLVYGRHPLGQDGREGVDHYVASIALEDEVEEAMRDLAEPEGQNHGG